MTVQFLYAAAPVKPTVPQNVFAATTPFYDRRLNWPYYDQGGTYTYDAPVILRREIGNSGPQPGEYTIVLAPGVDYDGGFTLTPPARNGTVTLKALANNAETYGTRVISYPHIPPITYFPEATAKLIRSDIKVLTKKVGYVMGAGDQIPDALQQLGIDVTLLSDDDLGAVA
mgnify:CR=1 FL=1